MSRPTLPPARETENNMKKQCRALSPFTGGESAGATRAGSSFKSKLLTMVALLSLTAGYAAAQSLSQEGDPRSLRPEDWIAGLPDKAQQGYAMAVSAESGPTRIEALRHWLSLWTKNMRDPNLTLVELDYVKYVIKYRDPLIDRALEVARKRTDRWVYGEWGNIQQAMSRKVSDLTSMENKLSSMRVRSGKQLKLAQMIAEHADMAKKERDELKEIVEYYKYLCRIHRWYYGWSTWWPSWW